MNDNIHHVLAHLVAEQILSTFLDRQSSLPIPGLSCILLSNIIPTDNDAENAQI